MGKREFRTHNDPGQANYGDHYPVSGQEYSYGARARGSGVAQVPQTRSVDSMKAPGPPSSQYNAGYQRGLSDAAAGRRTGWKHMSENWRKGYNTAQEDYQRKIGTANARARWPQFISDLNDRTDLQLVTDSQDVKAVKEALGKKARDYDGFFVKIENGEYAEVYGFSGSVPGLGKPVYRIPTGNPAAPGERLFPLTIPVKMNPHPENYAPGPMKTNKVRIYRRDTENGVMVIAKKGDKWFTLGLDDEVEKEDIEKVKKNFDKEWQNAIGQYLDDDIHNRPGAPGEYWMADAFQNRGALHRQLGIPEGQRIGKTHLMEIVNTPDGQKWHGHTVTPLMKKRAQAALNANPPAAPGELKALLSPHTGAPLEPPSEYGSTVLYDPYGGEFVGLTGPPGSANVKPRYSQAQDVSKNIARSYLKQAAEAIEKDRSQKGLEAANRLMDDAQRVEPWHYWPEARLHTDPVYVELKEASTYVDNMNTSARESSGSDRDKWIEKARARIVAADKAINGM
jgi:hypothetical protein